MPAGPFQKVICLENVPLMSLKDARQDFLSPKFARLIKRLGTAAIDDNESDSTRLLA
jgi:hypothetical protein